MKQWVLALPFAGLVCACGGSVTGGPTSTSGHGGASGAGGGSASAGGRGPITGGGGTAGGAGATADSGFVPYEDPGCPPETHIDGGKFCEVGNSALTCGAGERCVPYVIYGEKCRTEETGTRCVISGVGVQGDDCASDECADGFVCVSAGSGFECARLCTVAGGKSDCPAGLLCTPLDVDGYDVCG